MSKLTAEQAVDKVLSSNSAAAEDVELQSIVADAKLYDKYNKPVAAAVAGAGRAFTFGGSDQLLTATGAVAPETLKGLQEVNPAASVAGEVVGTVAGLVTPVGPVAGATRLGRGVEAAMLAKAAASAAERTAVKRITAKATATAAGGAAEGALYGTGQLLSEEALGDAELNAQNLLAAAGTGAALGGLVGGAFGTGFGAKDELVGVFSKDGKIKKAIAADLDPEMNAIKLVAPEGAEQAKLLRISQQGEPGLPKFSVVDYLKKDLQLEQLTSRQQLYERNAAVKTTALDDIRTTINNIDEAGGFQNLTSADIKDRIVKEVMDEFKQTTKLQGSRDSAEQQLSGFIRQAFGMKNKKGVSGLVKELTDEIPKLTDDPVILDSFSMVLDDMVKVRKQVANLKSRLDVSPADDALQAQIKELMDTEKGLFVSWKSAVLDGADAAAISGVKQLQSKVFKTLGEAEKMMKPVSAKELHELISGMGEQAWGKGASATSAKAFELAWGRTKDMLREFANAADNTGGLVKIWDDANRRFRTANLLEKPLSTKAAADVPLPDIKDAIVGGAAAMLGGPAAAAAAVTARKLWQSDLKKKAIVLGIAEKANNNAVQKVITSVENFFSKTARGVRKSSVPLVNQIFWNSGLSQDFSKPLDPVQPESDKEAFKNITKNVTELANDPAKLAYKVTAATQKMDTVAPKMAQASRESMVRAVQFLNEKLPKDRNQQFDILAQREFEPSSLMMAKFKRYVQVVEDPYSVLADMEAGTATIEHVEALQAVYPAIYNQIRSEMINYVTKNPTKLDYNQKTQLAILLQAPVVPSMRAKAVANFQSTFIPKEPEQGGAVSTTVGGLGRLKVAENEMTDVERIQSQS
jgi:hypothetical protein